MTESIEKMINDFIRDTGEAHLETKDNKPGVVFHDENEFVPFEDLGYNKTYGFFRLSLLPDVEDETRS